MTKFAVLGLIVAMSVSPALSASQPTPEQLIRADRTADAVCRGGDRNETSVAMECDRRERITGRLFQIGYCYGKKGQVGGDYQWHRCTPQSLMVNDLKPGVQN